MVKQKAEKCLDHEEMIKAVIKKQLEEDFPRGSSHYESMVELYSEEDGPAGVLYELRQCREYSIYSEITLKLVCDEFFI